MASFLRKFGMFCVLKSNSVLKRPCMLYEVKIFAKFHIAVCRNSYKNVRLVEVGKFESPMLQGQYEPGQLFYHRVFGYRGIILFPWETKVYDKDLPAVKTDRLALEPGQDLSTESKAHTYYMSLIDSRDQDSIRVRTRTNPLILEEIENELLQIEGIDNVGHEDIQPYIGTDKYNKQPISHQLFNEFFMHRQELGKAPQCIPTDTLFTCKENLSPVLALSSVYKESTDSIRITVIPYYIGSRSTTMPERTKGSIYQLQSSRRVREYWWRYCIRLENLGDEPVQLRERKWCIYTKKMNTINGRGVVGEEPVLSKEQPAFQYVSMISLDAPNGHMWGKYKMERLHSGVFFDVEIPNFALESKSDDSGNS